MNEFLNMWSILFVVSVYKTSRWLVRHSFNGSGHINKINLGLILFNNNSSKHICKVP